MNTKIALVFLTALVACSAGNSGGDANANSTDSAGALSDAASDVDAGLNEGSDGGDAADAAAADTALGTDAAMATDGATSADAATDVAPPGDLTLSMNVVNFPDNSAIIGATVTLGKQTKTVGPDAAVVLQVAANSEPEIQVVAKGYREFLINRPILKINQQTTLQLPDNTTIAKVAADIGVVDDSQKGMLSVYVFTGTPGVPGAAGFYPGTVVDIDASYGAAFARADAVYKPGNKTIGSHVLFVNVAPGVVTPKFTPPAGHVCDVGVVPVNVKAGAWTFMNVYCK